MDARRLIERERRLAPWIATVSVLPLALFIASVFARANVDLGSDNLFVSFFRAIDASSGAWLASGVLQAVGLAAIAVPLTYLYQAASARSDRMLRPFIGFCIIGPVLVGAQTLLQAFAQVNVAQDFVTQSVGIGDIYTLSEDLYEDSSVRQLAAGVGAGGALSLIFAMVYSSLWAVRTGLLTRFFGTMGMALGACLLFPPLAQVALPGLMLWFAFLALIVADRAPRGRPPAWDVGRAVPWLAPGEEAPEPPPPAMIDGDATEIPGVGENPNAARRERAKKRKRKRRR